MLHSFNILVTGRLCHPVTKIGVCKGVEVKNKVFALRQGRFQDRGGADLMVCPTSIPGYNAARERIAPFCLTVLALPGQH